MTSTSKNQTYSAYVSNTLVPALAIVRQQIAQSTRDIQEYQDLLSKLDRFQESKGVQETLVELGAGIWADAQVHDTSKVTLDLGLDVHLDLPTQEALDYTKRRVRVLEKKQSSLKSKQEVLSWQIAQFRGAIEEVSNGNTVSA